MSGWFEQMIPVYDVGEAIDVSLLEKELQNSNPFFSMIEDEGFKEVVVEVRTSAKEEVDAQPNTNISQR